MLKTFGKKFAILSRKFLTGSIDEQVIPKNVLQAMKQVDVNNNPIPLTYLKHRCRFLIGVAILVLVFHSLAIGAAEEEPQETEHQKLLKRYANQSLSQLKYAVKSEGFYNCRVALNVWEMNAKEAGIFDQELYDTFKKQIYEKSLNENLRWFEVFLNQKNYFDARICLQLWRMHAKEMGVFDEAQYEELKNKLK